MKRIPLLILCACLMLLTTATTAMGATCYTPWVSTTAYNGGATVSYASVNYTANWWTQGNEPDTNNGPSGSGQPWTSNGACGGGATATATATKTATAVGTATKTATATATSTGTGSCYTAWSYPVAYAVGALVSYNGVNYKCISAHTSNSAWTPNVTPTLWSVVGSCSGGATATPTATATGTKTATATATKTATPCQSNCGGGGKQFAPYMDISLATGETVASMASSAGLHAITLAFLVDGGCVANWGGLGGSVANATFPNGTTVASAISALESQGVSVIISWGGALGSIQSSCTTASQVQAMYQSVFNAYPGIVGQDFDIEGGITNSVVCSALAGLKSANSGKTISLTLPVEPTGLLSPQLAIVQACQSAGFNPDVVNVMGMDYGSYYDNGGQMGLDATNAGSATHGQTGGNVGVTPMIGVNDNTAEIFQLSDASTLVGFANSNSYITRLAFWSLARDNGGCSGIASATCSGISQSTYQFSSIFNGF